MKYKILPLLIKIILWGSSKDDNEKNVPSAVRVLLALVLAIVYLGLSALLFGVGQFLSYWGFCVWYLFR